MNKEHEALLYIITSVDDLNKKRNLIYSDEKKQLSLDWNDDCSGFDLSKLYLSSSSERMLRAGINLFNGNENINLIDCFSGLDPNNQQIMLNAIKIRFNL